MRGCRRSHGDLAGGEIGWPCGTVAWFHPWSSSRCSIGDQFGWRVDRDATIHPAGHLRHSRAYPVKVAPPCHTSLHRAAGRGRHVTGHAVTHEATARRSRRSGAGPRRGAGTAGLGEDDPPAEQPAGIEPGARATRQLRVPIVMTAQTTSGTSGCSPRMPNRIRPPPGRPTPGTRPYGGRPRSSSMSCSEVLVKRELGAFG